MTEVLLLLFGFCIVALVLVVLRPREGVAPEPAGGSPLPRPGLLAPVLAGLVAAGGLLLGTGLTAWVAVPAGLLAAISTRLLAVSLAGRRAARLELELADGIDLMVSTLRSGGSLADALRGAAAESGRGLRRLLQEMVERIQVGEGPTEVLGNLERRVPLESFRLFAFTLGAHWEGGGSIATTLSGVGASIRDRVEVARRVRSQAVETQASVVGVLIVTYGLGAMMWTGYPERVQAFVDSELGSMFIGLSVFLQAIGMFWVAMMTRIDV